MAKAVVDDDVPLMNAVLDSDVHLAVHTYNGPLAWTSTGGRTADAIRSELIQTVDQRLRT
jgi:hypothetical protein